jgi:SusD family
MTHHRDMMLRVAVGLVAAVTLATACDFSVTNPGPVEDKYLSDPTARPALVTGMRRALATAVNGQGGGGGTGVILYWGGAMDYEINPAGSTGSFGIQTYIYSGHFRPEDNNIWGNAQQARWVAESGITRFQAESAPEDSLFAAAYLWAGYANRVLGENFCDAVIDGGPKLPITAFFARADSQFTEALRIANGLSIKAANKANVVNAALAGRASVRADLATWNGNDAATWAAAVADANQVTSNTFAWQLIYSSQDQDQYNYLYWARANNPYRAHTQWSTWYEWYYRTSRDARVKNDVVPLTTTTLSGASAPGATTIAVASVTALKLAAGAWIAVDTGSAQEVVLLTGADTTGQTLTVAQALVGAHINGAPVADIMLGDAAVAKFGGRVPFMPEAKFVTAADGVNLSSGWEMKLIKAEAALVGGNVADAIDTLNVRRTNLGLPTYDPGVSADSAWTLLKAERMYELWLEARRMGDLRRWQAAGTPGITYDGVWQDTNRDGAPEETETMTSPVARDLCFPISQIETQTNPNHPAG